LSSACIAAGFAILENSFLVTSCSAVQVQQHKLTQPPSRTFLFDQGHLQVSPDVVRSEYMDCDFKTINGRRFKQVRRGGPNWSRGGAAAVRILIG